MYIRGYWGLLLFFYFLLIGFLFWIKKFKILRINQHDFQYLLRAKLTFLFLFYKSTPNQAVHGNQNIHCICLLIGDFDILQVMIHHLLKYQSPFLTIQDYNRLLYAFFKLCLYLLVTSILYMLSLLFYYIIYHFICIIVLFTSFFFNFLHINFTIIM